MLNGSFEKQGHSGAPAHIAPTLLPLPQVAHMACSDTHTALVTHSGELYTFGHGELGQLGYAATKQLVPRKVPLSGNVVGVACAVGHTVVLCTSTGIIDAAFRW